MYAPTFNNIPQFLGGGPTIVIRNTFLDISASTKPPANKRSQSAPAVYFDASTVPILHHSFSLPSSGVDSVMGQGNQPQSRTQSFQSSLAALTFPDYPQGASHFSNLERSTFVMSHQFTTPEIPSILSSYHVNLLRELTFKGCFGHSPFLEAQKQPQCCQSHPDSSHSQFSHSSSYSSVHINQKPVSISPFITGPAKTGLSLRSGQHNAVMHWALETRKLRSNNTITVSPPFDLNLTTNSSKVRFKIFILSNDRTERIDLKNGQSRNTLRAGRHTHRVGRLCSIELKCEEELPPETAISFMIKVGSGNLSETRGPVEHNFFSNAIGRLPKSAQFWDLSKFQDDNSRILDIFIELQVLSCHGLSRSSR